MSFQLNKTAQKDVPNVHPMSVSHVQKAILLSLGLFVYLVQKCIPGIQKESVNQFNRIVRFMVIVLSVFLGSVLRVQKGLLSMKMEFVLLSVDYLCTNLFY